MAMLAGLSTLNVKLSVGFEAVSGQKPAEFNVLHRINSIGGISIEPETIDASALAPINKDKAPKRIDFPAPVCPVIMIRPSGKSISRESINT